jgi:hypothetical protein
MSIVVRLMDDVTEVVSMARRIISILVALMLCLGAATSWLLLGGGAAVAGPLPTWYLAEGTTAWGFGTNINIENPNAVPVTVQITYMTADLGPLMQPPFVMAAASRSTINPILDVGERDFSTKVDCLSGQTIAVDRTMYWMGGPGSDVEKNLETHSSIGVTAPNNVWFLPEGSTAWGFETWLTVQNPNVAATNITITYMIEDFGPFAVNKTVPSNSRATYDMKDDIGSADASIRVVGDQPVICERSMYRDSRRMGHESVGATAPANDFYLAEGTTAWGFTTFLCIQNPNAGPNNVTVTYMKPSGEVVMPTFVMAGQTRETIKVNQQQPNTDLSIKVHGSSPLLAERPMYWGSGSIWGEVGHDSIGVALPHAYWYLPGGNSSSLYETWTCVQNPNPVNIGIEMKYFGEGVLPDLTVNRMVPANSRASYNLADEGLPPGRYAIQVRTLAVGQNIICERATYIWTEAGSLSARTSGEETIGGWDD